MHETSVVHSLIELIRERIAAEGSVRVSRVRLSVGVLSGVEPAALRFAFAAVSPGTIVEGAELEMVIPPLVAWCRRCDGEREIPSPQRLVCPTCGQATPDLLNGRELELESLEVHPVVTPLSPAR